MNDSFDAKQMDEILAKHGRQASNIIAIPARCAGDLPVSHQEIFPIFPKNWE